MHITGTGTAVPPHSYTQQECHAALSAAPFYPLLPRRAQILLQKVLSGKNGVEQRQFALPALSDVYEMTPDAMIRRFRDAAPELAERAARQALQAAGLEPENIDGLVIATCTGYLCPGLTSYVSSRLGMRQSAVMLDLVGLGCGAAIPTLRSAAGMVAAGQARHCLAVCVEIGSAAFYLDEDPGVIISASLFGDGAAAAVLSAGPGPGRSIRWVDSASLTIPEWRDKLRFDHCQGLLRNILAPDVPQLAAESAGRVFRSLAERHPDMSEIAAWIWHGGGRDVLRSLREAFSLSESDTRHSAEILRRHGNMSSPSCIFALHESLHANAPGGLWYMGSFGAGFSSHGALLEVG